MGQWICQCTCPCGNLFDIFPAERAEFLDEKYKRVVTTLEPVIYEDYYQLSPHGEKFYSETTLTPIFNDSQKCTHIVELVRDITKKKWGEGKLNEYWKKLRESNQRYSSMVYYNPNAVLSLDIKGKINSGNKVFESITGYSVDEIINCNFISLIHSEDVQAV